MSYNVSENGNGMVMPVAPMGGYGYGGNGGFGNGFGGDGAWWLLVLFLFAANGNGFGWGNGGYGGGAMPYIMNNTTNSDVQRGFDQQAIMTAAGDINSGITAGFAGVNQGLCSGFAGVNQALCNGFAGVNATVAQGFSAAEASDNARQMANMQQAFNSQTAITSAMNGLQSQLAQCCCDNRLATANLNSTILAENCADRAAVSDGIRDILTNQTANTQALINTTTQAVQGVYDKICQLELNAKNEKIADLQNQLTMANLAASQTAQTARLLADNAAQTAALEQYLNPAPIPAYQVQNPNCCATFNNCGCNCG